MSDDRKLTDSVSVEETAALLRATFPAYPDIQEMKSPPKLKEFLREYRDNQRTCAACRVGQRIEMEGLQRSGDGNHSGY